MTSAEERQQSLAKMDAMLTEWRSPKRRTYRAVRGFLFDFAVFIAVYGAIVLAVSVILRLIT